MSQGYHDAGEVEAALACLVPPRCYARFANPSVYHLESTLALLEGYGCDVETSCCATTWAFSAGACRIVR